MSEIWTNKIKRKYCFYLSDNKLGEQKDVTFIIPIKNKINEFVIGFGGEVAKVTWNGIDSKVSSFETVVVLEEAYPRVRLHGAKASPDGVLFVGMTKIYFFLLRCKRIYEDWKIEHI